MRPAPEALQANDCGNGWLRKGIIHCVDVEELAAVLLPGERVIWTGSPDLRRLFTAADAVVWPFSVLGGGFAVFWFVGALSAGGLAFALFGVPYVLLGL